MEYLANLVTSPLIAQWGCFPYTSGQRNCFRLRRSKFYPSWLPNIFSVFVLFEKTENIKCVQEV